MESFCNESEFLNYWQFSTLFLTELSTAERVWNSDASLPPYKVLAVLLFLAGYWLTLLTGLAHVSPKVLLQDPDDMRVPNRNGSAKSPKPL
jgi:hypothetical protein